MVSEKKIFKVFPIISLRDSLGRGQFDPRGLIGRIYVGDHYTLLHTKYISCGPHGFGEEDFLSFSNYKAMGAIYWHGGHLDSGTTTIYSYFQSPFNTRLHIKFEEIRPRGFRGEVVQSCKWTDDGRRVITIAHPVPLAQVS